MSTFLKMSAMMTAALVAGLAIFGGWFYTTIPPAPEPPASIGAGDSTSTVEYPDARQELIRRGWVDQSMREDMADVLPTSGSLGASQILPAARYYMLQNRVDGENTEALKRIVNRIGWPTADRVGEEAAKAAFLIAQHADHDRAFQQHALTLLEEAHAQGHTVGRPVAMMTDRLRVAEGRPQLYGTQATMTGDGITLAPIEDENTVDVRRDTMGLPPMDEYLEKLEETYASKTTNER